MQHGVVERRRTDEQLELHGGRVDLVLRFVDLVVQEVERQERRDGDPEPERGRDERFRDAAGDFCETGPGPGWQRGW